MADNDDNFELPLDDEIEKVEQDENASANEADDLLDEAEAEQASEPGSAVKSEANESQEDEEGGDEDEAEEEDDGEMGDGSDEEDFARPDPVDEAEADGSVASPAQSPGSKLKSIKSSSKKGSLPID